MESVNFEAREKVASALHAGNAGGVCPLPAEIEAECKKPGDGARMLADRVAGLRDTDPPVRP